MKFKTRKQKLKEYNDTYTDTEMDLKYHLTQYFNRRHWNLDKATTKAATKLKRITNQREYETIRIILYEYPMKTDRPRTFAGHTFSPNASANHDYFEKAVKQVVKSLKLINTPAEIIIDAYMEMPKQVKPDEVILFESKVLKVIDTPDYDNIGKCYTDMLKNTLITDDDIFHTGTIHKYYSVLPRVEIRITYLKSHESEYVYKKIKNRKSIKQLQAEGMIDLHVIE